MHKKLELEFPQFITHIPKSKKEWIKIGYNKIHAGVHFSTRKAIVATMHSYIEKHIPDDLSIQGPVETSLIVYAPINFGTMRMLLNKETNRREVNWKPAIKGYKPTWDIGNLAMVWLKSLDDVIIKKGILPDDNVGHLRKTSYEFRPIDNFHDRKLIYQIKTIDE